jgi:predicted PurR-regulated permease PerM
MAVATNGMELHAGVRHSEIAMVAPPDVPAPEDPTPELRELRAIRRRLTILALIALLAAIYFARALLLPIVLGFVIALTLRPLVRALERFRIPPAVSGVLVIVALGIVVLGAAWWAAGPVANLVADAPEIGQEVRWKLRGIIDSVVAVQEATEQVETLAGGGSDGAQEVVVQQGGLLTTVVGSLAGAGTSIVIALILASFLLATWDFFLLRVVEEAPRFRDKKRAIEIARNMERQISRYLGAITLINLGVGVATGLALWALGMPNPHIWGFAGFVLNYLPYLGAIAGTVAVGMVALVTFDSAGYAMLAPLAFYAITSLEGQIVTPMVLGRHLSVNTVAVLVTVMLWVWLWGIAGAFLAVPVLVIVKVLAENLPPLATFGRFLEAERPEPAAGEGRTPDAA